MQVPRETCALLGIPSVSSCVREELELDFIPTPYSPSASSFSTSVNDMHVQTADSLTETLRSRELAGALAHLVRQYAPSESTAAAGERYTIEMFVF